MASMPSFTILAIYQQFLVKFEALESKVGVLSQSNGTRYLVSHEVASSKECGYIYLS